MTTPEGDVVVLAVHRNGKPIPPGGATLVAGDTLLVRGSWEALEAYLASRRVLPVVEPDRVRRQAAPLDSRAWRGDGGPRMLLAGLFVLTALLGQLISNTATSAVASWSAAPVDTIAVDSGIIAPISTTVVQSTAR